jgi:acyl-coenzyme A thioesterase PaaI-like protein
VKNQGEKLVIATCPPLDTMQETSLRQIRDFAARIPVLKTLGFRLIDVQRGFVVFEGHVTEGLTQNEVLHGGILAAILEYLSSI